MNSANKPHDRMVSQVIKMKAFILSFLLTAVLLIGCSQEKQQQESSTTTVEQVDSLVQEPMTREQTDSLVFRLTHHYSLNYNFVVQADSLVLVPRPEELAADTCVVREDALIAVAMIRTDGWPGVEGEDMDSVWLKIVAEDGTMGWIGEQELLASVVPDNYISKVLHWQNSVRLEWKGLILLLGVVGFLVLRLLQRKKRSLRLMAMDSFYPYFLILLMAGLAVVYRTVMTDLPEYWAEYYFHPTLNPLLLPFPLSLTMVLVWMILIVALAIAFDVHRHLSFLEGVAFICETAGLSILTYLLFWLLMNLGVGYVALPLFAVVILYYYFKRVRCTVVCGSCGKKMREKGVCPHCGVLNT